MVKSDIVGEKALRDELAWLETNGPLVKAECRRIVRECDQQKKELLASISCAEIKVLELECSCLAEDICIQKLKLEQLEMSNISSLESPEGLGELRDQLSRLERKLHEANEQLKKLEKLI